MLQIVSGIIFDPASKTEFEADLLIDGEKIARIDLRGFKPSVTPPGTEVLHIHGAVCAPALWDIHVHLREPGQEHKETIATGAQAAARGGIGHVFAMANTKPAVDNESLLYKLVKKAKAQEKTADIRFIAAVTKARQGKELVDFRRLFEAGAAAFSDDGSPVRETRLLEDALNETGTIGSLVIEHCEDEALSAGGVMHQGETCRRLGLPGIPRESEVTAVLRALAVLRNSRGRLHIAHVSTKEAAALIRKAKKEGLAERLTCEACPHHFVLTDRAVEEYGAIAKVNPPLRTKEDIEAIRQALADGTIDAIASDHAPHSDKEKDLGIMSAPFGIIGMETMLPLVVTYLVRSEIISLMKALELLTVGPARIMKQKMPKIAPGEQADLVIFNPKESVTFNSFVSKSRNTPFLGKTLYGKVLAAIRRGRIVYQSS
ncbi:MAG: dihydroorotase [Elusimicrobia bacterium]|nr:dihydroorotase [Elusimicrobiota bacterium]